MTVVRPSKQPFVVNDPQPTPSSQETSSARSLVDAKDGVVAFDPRTGALTDGDAGGVRVKKKNVVVRALPDGLSNMLASADRGAAVTLKGDGRAVASGPTDGTGFQPTTLAELEATGMLRGVDKQRGGLVTFEVEASGKTAHARVMALPSNYDGPIFISDIDDTLRDTSKVSLAMGDTQPPVDGAPELLAGVAEKGVPIVYLSAAPAKLGTANDEFLKQLPAGVLLSRETVGLSALDPRNKVQAQQQGEFKGRVLAMLKTMYPNAKLFGLGDDKFGDAQAYTRHGGVAYVRDVQADDDNLPADFNGVKTAQYDEAFRSRVLSDLDGALRTSASHGGRPEAAQGVNAAVNAKLDALTGSKAVEGNKLELFVDGDQALPEILKQIDGAKKSIQYETYKFAPGDAVSERVAERLIAAKQRGVDVKLLVDGIGSREWITSNKTLNKLRDAGVDVKVFNPVSPSNALNLTNRNHRKSIVVDQSVMDGGLAFVGGMNTGDRYMGDKTVKGRYHDVVMKMEGPAVADVNANFWETWRAAGGDVPAWALENPGKPALDKADGGRRVRVIAHEGAGDNRIMRAYTTLINDAKSHINIENGFPMSDEVVGALVSAAQRGVKVRYIVGSDFGMLGQLAAKNYARLLDAGVEIYEYPTAVHMKSMSIDGRVATVGSANMDNMALQQNREIIAVMDDPAWVKDYEAKIFDTDRRGSAWAGETRRITGKPSLISRLKTKVLDWVVPDRFE